MRILMLTDVYFPRINGVSTSIETFRNDIVDEGVTIKLVAPDYPESWPDNQVWRVPSRRLPFDPEDRLMRRKHLYGIARHAVEEGIDLIHIQTPFAAHYAGVRLARDSSLPVIATYHTHFEEYIQHYLPLLPKAWLKAAARRLARHQCNALAAIVVPSPAMKETLIEYGVSAPLHVLPTGIPIDQFSGGDGARFRARHAIPAERPIALYVGRVAHEKNIDFLLQAMVHAIWHRPDLLLVIAGEGPALESLHRRVANLHLDHHVRFVGYLDRKHELPDCYAAANVFAFASRTETQGLVLLEAMAAGLPVFAIAHLGTTSILEPRRGAVVAPETAEDFGKGLADLISNRTALSRLAVEGREFAMEWSAPERARQLATLYRSLVI
ncbi:MAG: glycosyltransferase [Gammaproteobacteria bacterium]|nr:glycosyltransferase [Gammaproteobacteria bacterium]MBU1415336.1 glycosyltransferase [Gammaproteobacteria bacterium]